MIEFTDGEMCMSKEERKRGRYRGGKKKERRERGGEDWGEKRKGRGKRGGQNERKEGEI